MKKTYYQFCTELENQIYLHYNTFSNKFMLLNKKKHDLFELDCQEIKKKDDDFYKELVDNHFIVEDSFNGYEIANYIIKQKMFDSSMYQIVVNTTLDCNLNCWYCYENRISGSKLKREVVEAIKKNIELEYSCLPYKTLKFSFFGGEPFIEFEKIRDLLSFTKIFCKEKNIELIADFTTNATLITSEHVKFLKDFECHFQITLDGDRVVNNKIKKDKYNPGDTNQKVIENLRLIDSEIPKHWLAVRINFDNRTLEKIDEIISDIDFLDRKTCYVILKKVWQISTGKVNVPLLHEAIQKFFDKKFLLDYYIMPKGCVCFAQRHRETLFNYDGKIFKCTTISDFDDTNSLGQLEFETGNIQWNLNKIALWMKDEQPETCKLCKWYPVCFGICSKQILAHPNEKMCTFDAINMNTQEYLIYSFKYHLLQNELYKM